MRSVSALPLLLSFVLLGMSHITAQEVQPNCTSVGVPLCFTHNDFPCENFCLSKGNGVKATTCEILSTKDFRTDCQCSDGTGCRDVEYDKTAIPTCDEIDIWDCSNACVNLCKSFVPERNPACMDQDGPVTCYCDSVAVCDDRIDDPPAVAPSDDGGENDGVPEFFYRHVVFAFGTIMAASLMLS